MSDRRIDVAGRSRQTYRRDSLVGPATSVSGITTGHAASVGVTTGHAASVGGVTTGASVGLPSRRSNVLAA